MSPDLAVAAIDALGTDLYRRLLPVAGDGNLLLSPLSIGSVLAMAHNGAVGATRAEMDVVLRAGGDDGLDGLDRSLHALDQILSTRSGPKGDEVRHGDVVLTVANSVWVQAGLAIEPSFRAATTGHFEADVPQVDFRGDADGARQAINRWVAEGTRGRIEDLLPEGSIDAMTRLVLANARYLAAPWFRPFTDLGDQPFTLLDGTTTQAPTMSTSQARSSGSGPGWQAASIPYVGRELSMVVILPDDLAAFEASLDGPTLAAITSSPAGPLGQLRMPKFRFRSTTQLGEPLAAAGMPLAFDPHLADFSGITTDEALFVDDVHHQAFIAVDEEGTEAAAATGLVMSRTAAVLEHLTVDRPFVFVIRDDATGATLFLGRVTDPTAT